MVRIKRYGAPLHYPVPKKVLTWTVTPLPGPHGREECIPLQIIMRDVLGHANTAKEVRSILSKREVQVDGRVRTEARHPCGLMDTILIAKIKEAYRIVPKNGKLRLVKIEEKEAGKKLCQIADKRLVKGSRVQLNLHDGRNILIGVKDPKNPEEAAEFRTGDSLLLSLPDQKILGHIKMEKGALALVVKGRHTGRIGKVKQIVAIRGREPNKAVLDCDGEEVRTLRDYVFVVAGPGEKAAVSLGD